MSQNDYILETRRNKHLSEKERYTIEVLLKEKMSPFEIAKRLGRHPRTIEREIAKGSVELKNSDWTYRYEYCADHGQRVHDKNAANKGPGLKIGNDQQLIRHIEERIVGKKYSPDAVIGEIKARSLEFVTQICTKTLYNYIDRGVFLNVTNADLAVKRNGKTRNYKKVKVALHNLKGTSIAERPKEVNDRKEYGHWEMDCVVGPKKGKGSALLVLTERTSREEIIRKLPDKKQESVKTVLDQLEKQYGRRFKNKFKTITVDNGSEFLDFVALEQSFLSPEEKRVNVYYAHPYSSWERGSNENANKLIRRFIPKGTDISGYTKAQIRAIEQWINDYPRKIFGYKSSKEVARLLA
jgi:transposase, IS30 family